jgi:hypothetical protein
MLRVHAAVIGDDLGLPEEEQGPQEKPDPARERAAAMENQGLSGEGHAGDGEEAEGVDEEVEGAQVREFPMPEDARIEPARDGGFTGLDLGTPRAGQIVSHVEQGDVAGAQGAAEGQHLGFEDVVLQAIVIQVYDREAAHTPAPAGAGSGFPSKYRRRSIRGMTTLE